MYQLSAIFFLSYYSHTVHTVQKSRPKLRNKIGSFIFCWILIQNKNSGSGSRPKVPNPGGSGSITLVERINYKLRYL